MPGGDRTGPSGTGPMTGRRLGFCVGNDEPGGFYGRAYGSGRGPGMGFRHRLRGLFSRRNRKPDCGPTMVREELLNK